MHRRAQPGETYEEQIRRATVHRDENARAILLPGGTVYSVAEDRFVSMLVDTIREAADPNLGERGARVERRLWILRRLCRDGEFEEAEQIVRLVDSQTPKDDA